MVGTFFDDDLKERGISKAALRMFIQRWAELFHRWTIDTYRVKFLNAFRSLEEVRSVCDEVLSGLVSDMHLVPAAEEAAALLKQDPVVQARQRPLVGQTIANLQRKRQDRSDYLRLKAQVQHCYNRLQAYYTHWLIDDLQESVNKSEIEPADAIASAMGRVDAIASALASELVWKGYSERFLYRLAERLVHEVEKGGEPALWDRLRQVSSASPQEYSCFPLPEKLESLEPVLDLLRELRVDVVPGAQVPLRLNSDEIARRISADAHYVCFNVQALDDDKAATEALQAWARVVDALVFYRFPHLTAPRQVLLFAHGQRRVARVDCDTSVLPSKGAAESLRRAVSALDSVKCSQTDQDRIEAAFRHFRVASETASVEAKYSSLWTALETVVRGRADGAIIVHLKDLVPPVLCRRYPHRLLRNFSEDARRCGVDLGVSDEKEVVKLLEAILDASGRRQDLARRVQCHSLLSYRFSQICEQVKDAKALARTLTNHHTRVSWHLQRLYRIRNAIIHSGQVNLPIEPFVRHLQDYVWSSVADLCYLITEFGMRGLDEALELARDNYFATVELLNTGGTILSTGLVIHGVLGL